MREILQGESLAILRTLPANHFHCCVTSPPYWGLRDYQTGRWEGGDPICQHGVRRWDGPKQTQGAQSGHASAIDRLARKTCRCGALRVDEQLGLEPTPEKYVARAVGILREVWRVLRPDGTLWLNLGDSYAGAPRGFQGKSGQRASRTFTARIDVRKGGSDAKPKDLIGIPWMVAFALRADGWYLRSDVIWAKPNAMPESVTDRPTKSHEYLILLSKSERYYYDGESLQEPATSEKPAGNGFYGRMGGSRRAAALSGGSGTPEPWADVGGSRNARSVWTVPTQPSSIAHFATMAPELARRCIAAGSPRGGAVLDPFGGSGTTAHVAECMGRDATIIELNSAYIATMPERCEEVRRWYARRHGTPAGMVPPLQRGPQELLPFVVPAAPDDSARR